VAIGELAGGVVAPIVAGRLADLNSLAVPLGIQAALSLLAGLVAFFLRETNPAVLARRAAAAGVPAAG